MKGLAAFEAVERLGSVSAAASELSVTQPAISQQIKTLEQFLGARLFERMAHGLVLTADAGLFAARVRQALATIEDAADAMREQAQEGGKSVSVAVLSTFAQRWLIPRLAAFQESDPNTEVRLITVGDQADLSRVRADLSIKCGPSEKENKSSDFLIRNQIVPVASPELLAEIPIRQPTDLTDHNLIRIDKSPRIADWPAWLESVGLAGLEPSRWLTFDNSSQALEAAVAGLGIAISHTPFIADALVSGRLVIPIDRPIEDVEGDYYVHAANSLNRNVDRFRRWLLSEAQNA